MKESPLPLKEQKSDNELIAEFMGILVFREYSEVQAFPIDELTEWVLVDQMKYDTSWDWLMPVVEKIADDAVWTIRPEYVEVRSFAGELRKEKQFKFNTDRMDWEVEGDEPAPFIFLVYTVVTDFIKWRNSQKP